MAYSPSGSPGPSFEGQSRRALLKAQTAPHEIKLNDGRRFLVWYDFGQWSVSIDGKFYCAVNKESLLRGLETKFHVIKPKVDLPEVPLVDQAKAELKNPITATLVSRRQAREDLKTLSAQGDVTAALLLQELDKKAAPSKEALEVTKRVKKLEFADVTHEDLVEHVKNLVLRSKLILELSDRLRF